MRHIKLTLLTLALAALTGCSGASSNSTIAAKPSAGIVAFDPTVATSFVGTWVDQADATRGFTVDSSGNISGTTLGTWTGIGGPFQQDCTFAGVLANSTTHISGNSYQIAMYVATGAIHADHAYCPSYSTGPSFPLTKQFQFNDQGNNCILSGGVIGYNTVYCKQ